MGKNNNQKDHRIVTKHIFDSPLDFNWPQLKEEDEVLVIDKLASILSPIASYQEACRIKRTDEFMEKLRREYYPKEGQKDHRRRGKRRIGSNGGKSEEGQNKRQQADSGGEGGIVFSKNTAQKSIKPPQHKSPDGKEIAALKETAGELKSCISIGVNSITRGMEAMIVNQRQQLQQQLKETEKQQIVGNYRIVFVCLKDVSNPYFFSHIPSLCGISSSSSMVTYLVPLLKVGSQKILSQALGLKSVSCVAIKSSATFMFNEVFDLIANSSLEPISLKWLSSNAKDIAASYQKVNIKAVQVFMKKKSKASTDASSSTIKSPATKKQKTK